MFREAIATINTEDFGVAPEDVKLVLRQLAKKNPLYFKKVNNPANPDANTVGRILFGIPGFAGLYAQKIKGNEVKIGIEELRAKIFPPDTIEDVKNLLSESISDLLSERGQGIDTNRGKEQNKRRRSARPPSP